VIAPAFRLSVVANPSHLEAVNPVVEGKVRAEQFYRYPNILLVQVTFKKGLSHEIDLKNLTKI
jgi:hypothetical protein